MNFRLKTDLLAARQNINCGTLAYESILNPIIIFLDVVGGIILVYGSLIAAYSVFLHEARELSGKKAGDFRRIKHAYTHRIVFALEFFIAADILKTVLVPNMEDVVQLAVIVAIRTVLAHFLHKEMEGIK